MSESGDNFRDQHLSHWRLAKKNANIEQKAQNPKIDVDDLGEFAHHTRKDKRNFFSITHGPVKDLKRKKK